MKMKTQGVVAQVSQTLSELPDDQKTAVAEALMTAPGLTAGQRRARLALRIAMARLAPAPQPIAQPVPEPAPVPIPATLPITEPAAPEPAPVQAPAPEETPPPPPAPEVKKPRKPAKVAMSTVRIEDAAMLLGAAFAAMETDTPAADTPAADTPAPETPPDKPSAKPAIKLPPFPDDF
jgi:hypothetical protein